MAISSNLCIPIAVGVPNLNPGQPNYFGPPNWLDQSQPIQHPFDNTLDDPRWLGAAEHSYGDGLGEDARFRALYYTQGSDTNLYLSWNVQLNFQGTGADLKQDSLFVGFNPITSSGGSGPASIIEIGINANPGAGSDLPPPNYSITVLISSGNTWSTTGTDQFGSWLTDSTRLWVGSTADAYSWAVQMVVPLGKQLTAVNKVQGAGTTLGKSFNMWYQLQTTAAKNIAMVNPYPWPSSVVFDGSNLNTFPNPMQPTQWGLVNVGNNQANQPCAAVGVSITYDTIGNDAVGATYPGNTTVSLNKPNTLFADPVNNDPNTTVNPGEVAARFRLAKWGSQNPSGTWPDVPGASQVFNTLHIPPAPGETGHIIHFPWTLDPNDIPSYQAEPDRCLLVELSSTKNITFVTDTAFKNLMFETTSSFCHKAEISVVGLQPIPGSGPNRDVYLFVETVNMPAFIEREPESPEQPTSPEQPVIEERPGALGQLDPLDLDFDVRRLELNRMVAEGRLNIGEAKRVLPTYIVHAFHDTGEKVTIKGVDHPRVESQTSFGYIAVHNGPLYGWRHDLQADTLTEIAPNLYKISVPNHGAATVTTVIEALEHPGKSGGFMLQSTFGKKGNFEVVVPHETAGLAHCVRDNDDAPSFPWRGPHVFGQSVGKVDAVALIQSNFDFPGHLEVVARTGNRLLHFWRDSGPDFIHLVWPSSRGYWSFREPCAYSRSIWQEGQF